MAAIIAGSQTTVTGLPDGGWRVEKTGGIDGHYASAASSHSPITGDFVLRVTDLAPPNSVVFGVDTNPLGDDGYGEIDFAGCFNGSDFFVLESGAFVPPMHAHGGVVWMTRTGDVLSYRIGPRLAGSVRIRTVSGVSGALWFDCSIARLGGAIGVRFEPPGAWSGGAARSPARLNIAIGA